MVSTPAAWTEKAVSMIRYRDGYELSNGNRDGKKNFPDDEQSEETVCTVPLPVASEKEGHQTGRR